jgi:gliding motility-associated-like protein
MRQISLRLFFLLIIVVSVLQAGAQTCTGSLGDPVINQDFGSGTNPGAPLSTVVSNMAYTISNCPNDGEYTIANSLVGAGNCHPFTWHDVPTDHTGNPNGYMMIVNASFQPSVFFTQTATGLCPNTTYEFSSYILNLIKLGADGPNVSEPNITFSIQTTTGQTLAIDSTGTLANFSTPTWVKYGVFFTTPANVTDVVVTMTNNAPGGNGNDLILDDITFRACGPIIQTGFASTAGPAIQNICQGDNTAYTLKANVMGGNSPIYQWQVNNNNTGWTDIGGETKDSVKVQFNNAVTGTYQYRMGVGNGSNITSVQCRVYSPPLTVNVNPLPVVPAFAAQTVCQGNTLQLTASGGANYTWTGPNMPPTQQNPLIINNVTPANAGTYTVQVVSAGGCPAPPVQALVKVVPKVVAAISNDVTICAGNPTPLTASGGLFYKWTPSAGLDHDDIPDPVANPTQTTTYKVDVGNGGCDDSTRSVTVTVNQNPVANAGNDIKLFEGQSATLHGIIQGDNITSFYWTPATFLSDPTSLTPIASPTDDITYTLTVVSQTCGTSTSSVFVRVYKKITIPNTFSPNNDGINDIWNIEALETYPESSIMVYDRYGQKVYQSTGYAKPWNGTFNGSPLPQSTYYYVIDLKNNTPKIAGWVFIVR